MFFGTLFLRMKPEIFLSGVNWLSKNRLVTKNRDKYELTSKGKNDYSRASENTNTLIKMWDNMEEIIKNYA